MFPAGTSAGLDWGHLSVDSTKTLTNGLANLLGLEKLELKNEGYLYQTWSCDTSDMLSVIGYNVLGRGHVNKIANS